MYCIEQLLTVMKMRVTAGYGDPCTWGPCTGHPNDPRTDIDAENAAFRNWAEDQYKDCPHELDLLKCAFSDFDRDLLPQDSVKEYADDKDGSDVVFYLFPHVSSPLKDLLIDWMDAVKENRVDAATTKIGDILFLKGQEQLVKAAEQSYRGAVSDLLEDVFFGDKEIVRKASVTLFHDVAREFAEDDLIRDASDLYDSLEARWNQRGRYEYGRPDYD